MAILAVAGSSHYESRAAVFTGYGCERDFLRAQRTLFVIHGCSKEKYPHDIELFDMSQV